jgi:hypothetical protein
MAIKISDYTALTAAAAGDFLEILDISDTTMAVTGTNKKIVLSDLLASVLPLAGGTMTGTITSTLGSITDPKHFLDATATWNDPADTFYGIKQNVTITAAHASSRLLDLQVAGSSKFSVLPNGIVKIPGQIGEYETIYFGAAGSSSIASVSGGSFNKAFCAAYNGLYNWSSVAGAEMDSIDTALGRSSSGIVEANLGALGTFATFVAKEFRFAAPTSANGQYLAAKSLTELTTIAAAATTDTTIQLPANAIILGVSVRVTTAIPTATNFTVGDSGSAARFSTAAVSSAANSTDAGTKAGAYYNSTATSVRITPDATPGANTGRLRVTIHYLEMTPPTS